VLVDESLTLIAGHGRLSAAQLLGLDTIPAIRIDGLTDAQKQALRIADNKLALNAGWDDDLLRTELAELRDIGFDLNLVGFSTNELDQLMAPNTDIADEWQGMPEFEQNDLGAFQSIAVHFRDQAGVDAFAALVRQKITDKTKFLWFPYEIEESYVDKRYAAES
jgi:ParB-like chromosome segregation protein Spo0J